MAHSRRHRSSSVLLALLFLSCGLHSAAFALYEHLKPTPWPRLTLSFNGKGTGVVQSAPGGIDCVSNCSTRFAPGTHVRLVATVADKSTFEGWAGQCTPRSDWILECELIIEEDTVVEVGFGLMPDRVELAWVTDSTEKPEDEITVRLPDPEIEAEFLDEPLEDLIEEQPPEVAEIKPPQPVPPPPPEQAPAPPPAPKLEEMPNMRSVEVPDENEVEKAPDDATHLSDKNRDVAEETRTEDTNLEKAQAGKGVVSEQSDVQAENIGAAEDDIAQLEDAEPTTLEDGAEDDAMDSGNDEQIVGMISGEQGTDGEDGDDGDDKPTPTPGALSMRNIGGRGSLIPDLEKPGEGGKAGRRGKSGKAGIKTELAFEDYERIVGKDKVAQEQALGRQKKKSKRRGRFERKMGAVKSALENFTPEVKPGNQVALKTRAAPFALYIARMHRSIHELWGFGFLEDLDGKPAEHPLNNLKLWTKLEIIVNPDGTIHKINIVKNSGVLEFDVAAIDAVITGEPYGDTPKEIRSPDDRIYIHWGFYRNNRQCGTFNANPFILAEARPESADSVDDSDLVRKMPLKKRMAKLDKQAARAQKSRTVPTALPTPKDREALHTGNKWVVGLTSGNLGKMQEVSGVPFRLGDMVAGNSKAEVGSFYRPLIRDNRGRMPRWKLMTAGGYRKRFGSLPPGFESGKPMLLMVVSMGKQNVTLELTRQKDGTFRVTGMHR